MSTIAQSDSDPDFIAVIGADPEQPDFGQIVNRVDMPNIGDELHHFGYSADQRRLIVPGTLLGPDPRLRHRQRRIDDDAQRGERGSRHRQRLRRAARRDGDARHGPGADDRRGQRSRPSRAASSGSTTRTGEFVDYFGPGPERAPGEVRSDVHVRLRHDTRRCHARSARRSGRRRCALPASTRRASATRSRSGTSQSEAVIQTADLGANSGALDGAVPADRTERGGRSSTPRERAPSGWPSDDDGDGEFAFEQVLGADDGLELPIDLLLSYDGASMFVSNWFGNTVQQFDISDPFHPVLRSTVDVPHPNMLRLSPRRRSPVRLQLAAHPVGQRSRLRRSRGTATTGSGCSTSGRPATSRRSTADGSAWVSFANVEKQTTTGPAGPHMMLFDPTVAMAEGEH